MRRAAIVIASALALWGVIVTPAGASAQAVSGSSSSSFSFVSYGAVGGVPVSSTSIPVTVHGDLSVSFHGDAATGCAARGLCGYNGTVVWTPGTAETIEVATYRVGRRLQYSLDLIGFGEGPDGGSSGVTSAAVTENGGPGTAVLNRCVDAVPNTPSLTLPISAGRVRFDFATGEPDVLRTRCAGPFASDAFGRLPIPSLTLRGLLAGHARVSLGATEQFASAGLAGTVTGRLALAIGRPQRPVPLTESAGGRYRQLLIGYRATLAGAMTETIAGDANPLLCAPLGSCGLAGTVTVSPGARADLPATLVVSAKATTPWRDLLAAAGLVAHGDTHGVTASIGIAWTTPGTITSDLTQGATTCQDTSRIAGGFAELAGNGGRLLALYAPSESANGLTTRCPGPFESPDGALGSSLATTVPVSTLSPATARIPLMPRSAAIVDDGYTGRLAGTVSLTLRRLGVKRRVVSGPQSAALTGSFFS